MANMDADSGGQSLMIHSVIAGETKQFSLAK